MIRKPAVSGTFYPSEKDELERMVNSFLHGKKQEERPIPACRGVLVPHAGYVYSGAVAGAVYAAVEPPQTAVILCPNHTGSGEPFSLWSGEGWETPLGTVPIDSELAEAIGSRCEVLQRDIAAHQSEHAVEVQVPFLQTVNPKIRIIPIVLSTSDVDVMQSLGRAIAAAVEASGKKVLLVASSDMNHYETQESTEKKDRVAVDQMLALDEVGLTTAVTTRRISMCGYAPAAVVLAGVKALGATRAVLRRYQTSGDVCGDYDRVVGYAGITFH